jgi:hypothetical protein
MWRLKQWLRSVFLWVLVGVIVLLAVLFLPFVLAGSWLRGRWLQARYRAKWSKHGKPILFVYSDSPNWQRYIEEHWLPRLRPRAVILNWSERKAWPRQRPLEARVFRHFAGSEEFNPIAIYFPRQGPVRTIRFWQAFRDFKHGKEHKLKEAERELFDMLVQLGQEGV